jgi:hypothetical protein
MNDNITRADYFRNQARANRPYRVEQMNDETVPFWERALAALKVEEEEFLLRYKEAKAINDQVHVDRSKRRLTRLREAMQILEFSLHETE